MNKLHQIFWLVCVAFILASCADDEAGDFIQETPPSIDVSVFINNTETQLADSVHHADTLLFNIAIETFAGFDRYLVDLKVGNDLFQNLQENTPSKLGVEPGQVTVFDESSFVIEDYMRGQLLQFQFSVFDLIGQSDQVLVSIPVANSPD